MIKTLGFPAIRALQNLVGDSMAIDMGSASTVISVRDRGVVLDEPSLVAVDMKRGEVIAVGVEAEQKYGRESREVRIVAPISNGVVTDFEAAKEMLAHFVRKARSGVTYLGGRTLISLLSGVTPVDERALLEVAQQARIGWVSLIDEGLAMAAGAGVKVDDPHGSAIVDIGARTTNINVVASGRLITAHGERIGSADIDAAITDHVRRNRGMRIGAQTAERLKLQIASAIVPVDLAQETTISGRGVLTELPGSIEITAGEIYPVAQQVVRKIVDGISTTLSDLSPEIAGDIYERGIILTGGGAQFVGLADYLRDRTNLPVRIAEEPRHTIVRGLEQLFDGRRLPHSVSSTERQAEMGWWNPAM